MGQGKYPLGLIPAGLCSTCAPDEAAPGARCSSLVTLRFRSSWRPAPCCERSQPPKMQLGVLKPSWRTRGFHSSTVLPEFIWFLHEIRGCYGPAPSQERTLTFTINKTQKHVFFLNVNNNPQSSSPSVTAPSITGIKPESSTLGLSFIKWFYPKPKHRSGILALQHGAQLCIEPSLGSSRRKTRPGRFPYLPEKP